MGREGFEGLGAGASREGETEGPEGAGAAVVAAAVFAVAEQWEAARGELHADLVGAPGLQADPREAQPLRLRQDLIAEHRFFDAAARPAHDIGLVFHPVVEQKILQRAACFLRAAGQHGEIGLLHAALAHALGEARGLLCRLCIDHHAADRLVEPVDGIDFTAQLRGKQLRQCLRIHPLRRNAHGLDADNGGFCFLQNFDHSCPLTFLPF